MAVSLALHDVTKIFGTPGAPGTAKSGAVTTGTATAGVTVLSHASYTFSHGKTYALLGISGTGKSTILQLLAGLEQPSDGAVISNGKSLSQFTPAEERYFLHETVGTVFQMPHLIDELSVRENIMLKGLVAGQEQELAEQRAQELLEKIGLTHKADALPAGLSGGEQQRVALARSLFIQPQFLLADEPTAHLDAETKKYILQLILEFQQSSGMGVIIATHDAEVAHMLEVKVRIIDGKLITEG